MVNARKSTGGVEIGVAGKWLEKNGKQALVWCGIER
jgi:hypothetical protein